MAWDSIIGQELAKRILQEHLATARVAQAYLLAGPQGVGKRLLALEMAKVLNCVLQASEACDVCHWCVPIARGVHPDVHGLSVEADADRIKIDAVRQMLSRIALRPFNANVSVVILDGVERLTEEAANALLKSLEEPPAHARFILITSVLSGCLPTIVSRCQIIRCPGLNPQIVAEFLKGQSCDEKTAGYLSVLSCGSLSRAMAWASEWEGYQRLLARFEATGPSTWLEEKLPETRKDLTRLLDGMVMWLRDVAFVASDGASWVLHADRAKVLDEQAQSMDVDLCVETAFQLLALRESLEQFVNPRLVATLAREQWLCLLTGLLQK